MDAGTMAIFADAAGGAVFAVWQPDRHRGAELVNAPGALTMNELDTRDPDGAVRFYGAVFGWDHEPVEQAGAVVYGQLKLDGRLVAGLLPMGPAFPAQMPVAWVTYFGVEDLEAAASRAQERGGRATAEPTVVPKGRFLTMADPHGAAFAILEGQYDPPPGG
jgi:predicted enzyme related to lactoylglutathione lyase